MQFFGRIFGSNKKANINKSVIPDDIEKAIAKTVEVFLKYPHKQDPELMDILENSGLESTLAEQMVLFVPHGITHFMFSSNKAKPNFSDTYIVMNPDTGKQQEYPLNEQKVYLAAFAYAPVVARKSEAFLTIASRCAEFKVINQALHAGSNIEDLVLSSAVITANW